MLTTLRIKNLALVADLTVQFQPGYNVITGETGAGKSMLIGALNLVLGERADRSLIRSGCDTCSVEAFISSAEEASSCDVAETVSMELLTSLSRLVRFSPIESKELANFVKSPLVSMANLAVRSPFA